MYIFIHLAPEQMENYNRNEKSTIDLEDEDFSIGLTMLCLALLYDGTKFYNLKTRSID